MHPEIVKDSPGECDVCGMPLVRAESLGYVAVDADDKSKPLVIPVTAALVTGTRAIVYVELPGTDEPTFEGREIVLGPRAGDYYLVRSGLKEGEMVVTNGNGVKLPVWSIGIILALIVQIVVFSARFSKLENNSEHIAGNQAETQFVMGNIQEEVRSLNDKMIQHKTWDELKTQDMCDDIDDLQGYHPR